MIKFELDCTYTAKLNNKFVNATCIDIYCTGNDLTAMFEIDDNPDLVYWGKIKTCKLAGGGRQETIINEDLSVYSGD